MTTGNILNYMEWRGDISLIQAPFCDVDNLILALLSYVELEGIVPTVEEKRSITVLEAAKRFFETHTEAELRANKSLIADSYRVLGNMARTRRFSGARLCNLCSIVDENIEMQFMALHIQLEDGTTYISFRGTDDTLIGWKEDFNMAYRMPVPSQIEAVEYLEKTVHFGISKLRLGGHSKGGNLAIYAAIECKELIQRRIIGVYSNDGPGFLTNMVRDQKYQKIKNRIKSIVPENTIIGMMLEHDNEYIIVKSRQTGAKQHDGLTWEVMGNHFVAVDSRSQQSMIIDKTIRDWLSGVDDARRFRFVDVVFDLLASTGARNLSELNKDGLKKMNLFLKNLNILDKETRSMIFHLAGTLTYQYNKAKKEIKQQNKDEKNK